MKRLIDKSLLEWKEQLQRMPLLIRGARQVGKTYTIEQFGHNNFDSVITINFEYQPEFKKCFETYEPDTIINSIAVLTGQNIVPGKTLLFLDEIQECPQAISALRYFKEKKPDLHIVGAGSLLEFAINDEDFKMPVGRVQFLYMRPLTFSEFLLATGNEKSHEYLSKINKLEKIDEPIHDKLLKLVGQYMMLGGMPAVVQEYIHTGNLLNCRRIQSAILAAYRMDFGKYATKTSIKHLQKVFDIIPGLICKKFKYTDIDRETRSYNIKEAIDNLVHARILSKITYTTASGLPLTACCKPEYYKLLYLDVGLLHNTQGIVSQINQSEELMTLNRGMMAEQFVGQELLGYMDSYSDTGLFYWERDKKSSSAEVDYIIHTGSALYPLEVKAGATGKLKSLELFLKEKKIHTGIRISQQPLSYYNGVLSIPLYMIEWLPGLLKNL